MKKRFLALFLVTTFISSAFAPTVALAHRHYRDYRPYRYYHSRHHWDSDDTWVALGLLGLIGYAANQQSRVHYPDYQVVQVNPETAEERYEREKIEFIRDMDKNEYELWNKIKTQKPGEYFINYSKGSTARRIEKFAKTLYQDLEFVRNDEENKIVYFNKLSDAE